MVIDTFLFGWELDLLECRLVELENVVDIFILVESSSTFQGSEKPLYYLENMGRYRKWKDRIMVITPSLTENDPWQREYSSRNCINSILSTFPKDAVVIHSDVDEFPSEQGLKQTVRSIQETQEVHGWSSTMYSMAINWKYPNRWLCTMGAPNSVLSEMTMTDLRNHRYSIQPHRVINDGWHFSWLGGKDFIEKKAASFSHTEEPLQRYVKDMGERLLTEGFHVLGEKLIPVDIDDTYPKYIRNGNYPTSWLRPYVG